MFLSFLAGGHVLWKLRLLKAEVVETLLYGCMTWSPKKPDYDRLRRVTTPSSSDALDGGNGSATTTPYRTPTLAKTASESMEAIVRKRRTLFAELVARVGEKSLPQRVMFGELVGVN